MRFAVVAAVLASSVSAQISTAYTTELVTVTACPETVTNCPARSTTVSTNIIPVVATPTAAPVQWNSTVSAAVPAGTGAPAAGSACEPAFSVTAITKSYTTVLTSVEYATVQVACTAAPEVPPAAGVPPPAAGTGAVPPPFGVPPPFTPPAGTGVAPPAAAPPAGTGVVPPPMAPPQAPLAGNGTVPPVISGGVASFSASALFAAAAGIAAFVLA